jgi:hypothetical protein
MTALATRLDGRAARSWLPPADVRALARVEARCLLRHPVFLVGVMLTAVIALPSTGTNGQAKLFILLGDGTDELFGALPRRGISRTAAQLLAVAATVPVAVVLLGVLFVAFGAADGLVVGPDGMRHTPVPAELAQGPLLVVFLGAAGIALARLAPSVVVAPLALVGLLALEVPVTVWQAGGSLHWLAPLAHDTITAPGAWVPCTPADTQPGCDLVLGYDLAGMRLHLLYLACLTVVAAAAALHHRSRP